MTPKLKSQPAAHRRVGEAMHRRFIAVEPSQTLLEAQRLMQLASLRHLPVARGQLLVGMLTYRDLMESLLNVDQSMGEPLVASLAARAVDEYMQAPAEATEPHEALSEAFGRMLRQRVGCLPVVVKAREGRRLVGLLSETDLLRAAYDPSWRPTPWQSRGA